MKLLTNNYSFKNYKVTITQRMYDGMYFHYNYSIERAGHLIICGTGTTNCNSKPFATNERAKDLLNYIKYDNELEPFFETDGDEQ